MYIDYKLLVACHNTCRTHVWDLLTSLIHHCLVNVIHLCLYNNVQSSSLVRVHLRFHLQRQKCMLRCQNCFKIKRTC